tara:strand:+ start:2302 stop:2487 length:186 start_codon:yes stop_codon:yes gene_type:complete
MSRFGNFQKGELPSNTPAPAAPTPPAPVAVPSPPAPPVIKLAEGPKDEPKLAKPVFGKYEE